MFRRTFILAIVLAFDLKQGRRRHGSENLGITYGRPEYRSLQGRK